MEKNVSQTLDKSSCATLRMFAMRGQQSRSRCSFESIARPVLQRRKQRWQHSRVLHTTQISIYGYIRHCTTFAKEKFREAKHLTCALRWQLATHFLTKGLYYYSRVWPRPAGSARFTQPFTASHFSERDLIFDSMTTTWHQH